MSFTGIPNPVPLALNPEKTVDGKQDYYRAWRTVSKFLTAIGQQLYVLQTYINQGIYTLNGLFGAVNLVAGANVTITKSVPANTLTIAAAGGGGGAVQANALVISPGQTQMTWAVPAAVTEFMGVSTVYQSKFDVSTKTQARFVLNVNSMTTPVNVPTFAAQYFDTGSSTWKYMDGVSGPVVTWTGGLIVSAWVSISATAIALGDVALRVVGAGGNGIAVVNIGTIYVQVR